MISTPMTFAPSVPAILVGDVVFLEPWGFLGLLAPVLLLLFGLVRRASREAYLGTARFFRSEVEGDGGSSRRSVPAWLVAAVAALTLGTLALAHPGVRPTPPTGAVVDLVIDRTPSMFHPVRRGDPNGPRRIDVALDAFREWAARHERETQIPVLVRSQDGRFISWSEVKTPEAPEEGSDPWLHGPLWPALDAPGVIWITDGAIPSNERKYAGLFASGGAGIPGPIATGPAGSIDWLGDGTLGFRAEAGDGGAVFIGPGVPDLLRELVLLWAADRGLVVETSDPARAGLRVQRSGEPDGAPSDSEKELPTRVGRDGWEATVAGVSALGASDVEIAWLVDGDGRILAGHSPGEIQLGFGDILEPADDPAAFAVSWIAWFDRMRPAPPQVLEVVEREGAGSPVSAPPADLPLLVPSESDEAEDSPPTGRGADRIGALLRSFLAGTAAALGLLAVTLLSLSANASRGRSESPSIGHRPGRHR